MTVHDPQTTVRAVVRIDDGDGFDRVVVEEPLEIRVGGEPIAVTMRTPGNDRELAAGFLLTEGVLRRREELVSLAQRDEANVIDVTVASGVDASSAKRALYSASSCGLCGKATIAAITARVARIEDETVLPRAVLLSLPDAMRAAQPTFDRTGGLHAAALFDARGVLEILCEDIGRHNATDKVLGHHLLAGAPLAGRLLLVSGRVGFEIVQKAAVAGVPFVAGISAPSSLAIDLAERAGITLVGFLRPPRANLYTHRARVVG